MIPNLDLESLKKIDRKNLGQTIKTWEGFFPQSIIDSFIYTGYQFSKEHTGEVYYLAPDLNQNFITETYKNFGLQKEWSLDHMAAFKNMLLDMKKVNEILNPIAKILGVSYEIGLTGGALRDLLNDKIDRIKDLDMVVYINHPSYHPYSTEISLNKVFEDSFEKCPELIIKLKDLDLPKFIYDEKIITTKADQYFFHVVSNLIKKNLVIDKEYAPRENSTTDEPLGQNNEINKSGYDNKYLRGVIKTKDVSLHYPVDILLTNSPTATYTESFDFYLCKIFLNFDQKNINTLNNISEATNLPLIKSIFNSITYNKQFLKDVIYKKITLNPFGFNVKSLSRSMLDHFPRIQEKYQDYTFNIDQSALDLPKELNEEQYFELKLKDFIFVKNLDQEVSQYLKLFIQYHLLNQKIPDKENKYKKVRNKI
jgi:hypothetical protein